jgi:hypothetical protein
MMTNAEVSSKALFNASCLPSGEDAMASTGAEKAGAFQILVPSLSPRPYK